MVVPTVPFRVPGRPGAAEGYEASSVVSLADAFLTARAAGPLKKQPARAATVAEALVRAAAPVGMVGLIDEATGYAKVRTRQSAQRTLQAFIAEDIGAMGVTLPEGVLGGAGPDRGNGLTEATVDRMGDLRDALRLRRHRRRRRPGAASSAGRTALPAERPPVAGSRRPADGSTTGWLGGPRRDAGMPGHGRVRPTFAKVLHKGPSHAQLPEGGD